MDKIAPFTLMSTEQAVLTKYFQQIIGDINWLSISTLPDITTIASLLLVHSHSPEPAHFDSALHIVKYLASNPFNKSETIHAFVHFPDDIHSIQAYCNANWGPMDAFVPKPIATPREQSPSSLQSISGWFLIHTGSPIAWGCACHTDTTQRS